MVFPLHKSCAMWKTNLKSKRIFEHLNICLNYLAIDKDGLLCQSRDHTNWQGGRSVLAVTKGTNYLCIFICMDELASYMNLRVTEIEFVSDIRNHSLTIRRIALIYDVRMLCVTLSLGLLFVGLHFNSSYVHIWLSSPLPYMSQSNAMTLSINQSITIILSD